MSGFRAFNLESDDSSEDELDDTEELQFEEALKVYQSAIALHAQGPNFYDAAQAVYQELFNLPIFLLDKSEHMEAADETDGSDSADSLDSGVDDSSDPTTTSVQVETAASNISQLRHVTFKNHGQLILDVLKSRLEGRRHAEQLTSEQIVLKIKQASQSFLRALEYDGTDRTLWRRTASVFSSVGSVRLARFCLESAIGPNSGQDNDSEHLSLDGLYAQSQLSELLGPVDALYRSSCIQERPLATRFRALTNPFPWLSGLTTCPERLPQESGTFTAPLLDTKLSLHAPTWTALYQAVADTLHDWTNGKNSGYACQIGLPPPNEANACAGGLLDSAIQAAHDNDASKTVAIASPYNQPSIVAALASTAESQVKHHPQATNEELFNAHPDNDEILETEQTHSASTKRKSPIEPTLEEAEGLRARSKRLKTRDSLQSSTKVVTNNQDPHTDGLQRLQELDTADDAFLQALYSLSSGIEGSVLPPYERARTLARWGRTSASDGSDNASVEFQPLRSLYRDWNDQKGRSLTMDISSTVGRKAGNALESESTDTLLEALIETDGIAIPDQSQSDLLQNPSSWDDLQSGGLHQAVTHANEAQLHIQDLALHMLLQCLAEEDQDAQSSQDCPLYLSRRWSPSFRTAVITLIEHTSHELYQILDAKVNLSSVAGDCAVAELTQAITELKFDHTCNLVSNADFSESQLESIKNDIRRWLLLGRKSTVRSGIQLSDDHLITRLQLRHTLLSLKFLEQFKEIAVTELITHLAEFEEECRRCLSIGNRIGQDNRAQTRLILPNCLTMSEISVDTVRMAIKRIRMTEMFRKLLNPDDEEPLQVIRSFEPLLEEVMLVHERGPKLASMPPVGGAEQDISSIASGSTSSASLSAELVQAMTLAPALTRVHLWRRLQHAYSLIAYPQKVLTCAFQILEIVSHNLFRVNTQNQSHGSNQLDLIAGLKEIHHLTYEIDDTISELEEPFHCMDLHLLQRATATVTRTVLLLFGDMWYRDCVKLDLTPKVTLESRALRAFERIGNKLMDTSVKLVVILYKLIQETSSQQQTPTNTEYVQYLQYLRTFHAVLARRSVCGTAGNAFLKLAKREVLMWHQQGKPVDSDLAQLMWEMHGLKIGGEIYLFEDHESPRTPLDSTTAMRLVDFVLDHIKRIPERDLSKADYQHVFQQIDLHLPAWDPNSQMRTNKAIISAYLDQKIKPLDLYDAFKGRLTISALNVRNEDAGWARIAAKGWLFAKGTLLLRKWRAASKTQPDRTELNLAAVMLRRDLHHNPRNWDTWYQLAQVYHEQVDCRALSDASFLRLDNDDAAIIERHSILAFAMAVSLVMQTPALSASSMLSVGDMMMDYGYRLYGSSTPPFCARAFQTDELDTWYNHAGGAYPTSRYKAITPSQTMKVSAMLFHSMQDFRPPNWEQQYMLAKCHWKLSSYWSIQASALVKDAEVATEEAGMTDNEAPVNGDLNPSQRWVKLEETKRKSDHYLELAIANAEDAVRLLPEIDKRHRTDPVLEPHYRIVSLIHKLVCPTSTDSVSGVMTDGRRSWEGGFEHGYQILQVSSFIRSTPSAPPRSQEDWKSFILQCLKILMRADKAGWHHRMSYRAATIWYRDGLLSTNPTVRQQDFDPDTSLLKAKAELVPALFKPSGDWHVWRPEHERAGRHFAYTASYIDLYTRILELLRDRASFEVLLRKLHKKGNDVFEHRTVWRRAVLRYLDVTRRVSAVMEDEDLGSYSSLAEKVFDRVYQDHFNKIARLLDSEVRKLKYTQYLVDVAEIKRLNDKLATLPEIDKLLAEIYAKIFQARQVQYDEEIKAESEAAEQAAALAARMQAASGAPTSDTASAFTAQPKPTSASPSQYRLTPNPMDLSSILSGSSALSPSPSPGQIRSRHPISTTGPPSGSTLLHGHLPSRPAAPPRSEPQHRSGAPPGQAPPKIRESAETPPKLRNVKVSHREIVKKAELLAAAAKRVLSQDRDSKKPETGMMIRQDLHRDSGPEKSGHGTQAIGHPGQKHAEDAIRRDIRSPSFQEPDSKDEKLNVHSEDEVAGDEASGFIEQHRSSYRRSSHATTSSRPRVGAPEIPQGETDDAAAESTTESESTSIADSERSLVPARVSPRRMGKITQPRFGEAGSVAHNYEQSSADERVYTAMAETLRPATGLSVDSEDSQNMREGFAGATDEDEDVDQTENDEGTSDGESLRVEDEDTESEGGDGTSPMDVDGEEEDQSTNTHPSGSSSIIGAETAA